MIPIPQCIVVTTTAEGRVDRLLDEGTQVREGDVVATVDTGGRRVDLTAPGPGRIQGFLAHLAQPVASGDGVVWLARA